MRAQTDYTFLLELIIVLAFALVVSAFIIIQYKPAIMDYIGKYVIGNLPKTVLGGLQF